MTENDMQAWVRGFCVCVALFIFILWLLTPTHDMGFNMLMGWIIGWLLFGAIVYRA